MISKNHEAIADVSFDMSYSFIFSARPRGTPAADMVDDVPEEEAASVYSANVSISRRWHGAAVCSARHSILVEGTSRKALWNVWPYRNNRVVNFEHAGDIDW